MKHCSRSPNQTRPNNARMNGNSILININIIYYILVAASNSLIPYWFALIRITFLRFTFWICRPKHIWDNLPQTILTEFAFTNVYIMRIKVNHKGSITKILFQMVWLSWTNPKVVHLEKIPVVKLLHFSTKEMSTFWGSVILEPFLSSDMMTLFSNVKM